MNVLLSPQHSHFHHHHEASRRSPSRSMSPFNNMIPNNRKRRAEDDGDEMSVSPSSSPAFQSRQLARPNKRVRSSDPTGRPLTLPRLLETLDATQLRSVLQTICERQPEIGEEVVKSAPRPSVECALQVLSDYHDKLRAAFPYGGSTSDYTYFRVKQPLLALIDALADFTPQYLPPNETQAAISLQFLDGATKLVHSLPEWESHSYRHHKENAYDEISKAWALVINEASKKGAGFALHSDGWDQTLTKHNEESGGRLQSAITAMAANVGWVGGNQHSGPPNAAMSQPSILDQLVNGTYGSPVRVGPWPGDQVNGIANPFETTKPRISEYTAAQIATLQSRLEKQLGPEYISSRAGPGGQKVHYIAADKCINLANEVFGFNGWSTSIQNIQVDFVDENPQTLKISLGLSMIVRVTLKDGTFHEDIGYGHIENCKGKAAAFEKSKKEAKTDALKRVLRNFGNVLGNCLYDKDYLGKVTKMKVTPAKFDESKLYRHSDYMKKEQGIVVKVEPKAVVAENDGNDRSSTSAISSVPAVEYAEDDFGDFDMADFGVTEDDHPDGVILPGSHDTSTLHNNNTNENTPGPINGHSNGNNNPHDRHKGPPPPGYPSKPAATTSRPAPQGPRQPQTPYQQGPHRPGGGPYQQQGRPNNNPQQQHPPRPPNHASLAGQQPNRTMTPPPNASTRSHPSHPPVPHPNPNPQPNGGANEPPATFFSARAVVKDIPADGDAGTAFLSAAGGGPGGAKVFNPKAESPSIRKTPGIDHRSSKPVSKSGVHVQPVKRDLDTPVQGQQQGQQQQQAQHNQQRPGAPPNVVNPAMSQVRQIGAPGGPGSGSPLGNRGQYRPLTMKRPAPGGGDHSNNNGGGNAAAGAGGGVGGNRTPLTEVTSNGPPPNGPNGNGAGVVGADVKRQKIG
ncbi:hypothetical protein F5Y16DRAFT_407416 [Xylariaceae sp. FL0255]|nr:hypothetical protein F5Y16DRAFT_407416 [Xylariaceae sp. FL0255]